ncbi:MAG: hypothetical protein K2V38_05610, partial [Gemmataceae bacterium]|nr:hypothetical protein [Gemmataceae bacterium]
MPQGSRLKKWLTGRARRWTSPALPERIARVRSLAFEALEDRDCPAGVIGLSAATLTTPENVGAYTFTVTRTGANPGDLNSPATVGYAVTDGTAVLGVDYSRLGTFNTVGQALSGTLSFTADATATTQTTTVGINIVETRVARPAPRTLSLTLSSPTGDALGAVPATTLSITDVAPGLPVVRSIVPSLAAGRVTITVGRDGGSFGALNIPW